MLIKFHKLNGIGNDFIIFDGRRLEIEGLPNIAKRLCDRRRGIGADGIIALRWGKTVDYYMDYYNADGSRAEMCGNGIRCLGKYIYDGGIDSRDELRIDTLAGIRGLQLFTDSNGCVNAVRVDMGVPVFDPAQIPVQGASSEEGPPKVSLNVGGSEFTGYAVSMGNPHVVIFTPKVESEYPTRYGPSIEVDPHFPQKTNVEFVRVHSVDRVEMRVWERGCGETDACGTGASASAAVSILLGKTEKRVTVNLLGGELEIEWDGKPGSPLFMTGPVELNFVGEIEI